MKQNATLLTRKNLMENYHYLELFRDAFGTEYREDLPVELFFSPGRVNIIGEHIDYNGGMVLPAALDIGIYGIAQKRSDATLQIKSNIFNSMGVIRMDDPDLEYHKEDGWVNYVKGMTKYLMEENRQIQPMNILFVSNLPDGAGLSSSAALEILVGFMLLYENEGMNIDRVALAKTAKKMENEYIGVNCGIMDQFAVAMGRENHAILLDTSILTHSYIPFVLQNYSLVIAHTNKKRELNESKYNERARECREALAILQKNIKIDNLVEAFPEHIDEFIPDPVLKRRALHVSRENERVIQTVKYMTEGDILSVGRMLTESHESLKNLYEVSGFELDVMVEESLRHHGCIGARMTGAGFGGCAIALVENYLVDDFMEKVSGAYEKKSGRTPHLFVARIDDGTRKLESSQ